MEVMPMRHTNLLQRITHQLIILIADFLLPYRIGIVHLHAQQQQLTIVELPHLPHPTVPCTRLDVLRSQQFRINQRPDAHLLEDFQILRLHVLIVIHPCHRLLRTQLPCQHCTGQVLALVGSHGDKQVRTLHLRILQSLNGRRLSDQRHDVQFAAQTEKFIFIRINQHHILSVVRQHASQMRAHGTCASNHDFHTNTSDMLCASIPQICRNSATVPCITNLSGIPMRFTSTS